MVNHGHGKLGADESAIDRNEDEFDKVAHQPHYQEANQRGQPDLLELCARRQSGQTQEKATTHTQKSSARRATRGMASPQGQGRAKGAWGVVRRGIASNEPGGAKWVPTAARGCVGRHTQGGNTPRPLRPSRWAGIPRAYPWHQAWCTC